MADQHQVGMVQTVNGLVDPGRMGITLTHEHLLFDSSPLGGPPSEASLRDLYYRPVSFETLGWIRHHAVRNRDNSQLLDISDAIEETALYKQFGGGSLVDATSIGIARDPIGLARISRHTGVNIVMGAAHYVHTAHPADMDGRTEDEIFERIVTDLTEGADGTDVKSGIIGEVGCSWPLT
ncbi:MAG: phosphotriesterase-related protein, partial [Chloroflexi bacterium]|nr:phosphotriesterase-related protein [Chloroflexota bacterium]